MSISFDDIKRIIEFYENLGDEESKKIYEARWLFCNEHDRVRFIRTVLDLYTDWRLVDFSSYYERRNILKSPKKIVLYGFGKVGKINKSLLEKCGYTIDYVVDRNYKELNKEGSIPICSPERVYHDTDNPIVIISISNPWEERTIFRSLRELHGIYSENIYFAANGGVLLAEHGNQYFDLPYMTPENSEIFIDGGCFDGETTKQFKNWAGESLKQVIAFECDKRSIEVIKKNMSCLAEAGVFTLIETGLYSHEAELHFVESTLPTGSCISESGDSTISVNSIDNVMNGEKVTFIKLDVQGVELEVLKGAEKTIRNFHPKLAVSLYHKDEDIYKIPLWLMEKVPEYKFYIRHYNTDECETILYAI